MWRWCTARRRGRAGRRSGAGIVAGVLTGPHSAARLRAAGATNIMRSVTDLPELILSAVTMSSELADAASNVGVAVDLDTSARAGTLGGAFNVPAQAPMERRTLGL